MNPITHVAIIYKGITYSLPPPNRHHNVIWKIVEETKEKSIGENEQGFLDSAGNFLNRTEALVNAQFNNQLRVDRPIWHDELFSENLW